MTHPPHTIQHLSCKSIAHFQRVVKTKEGEAWVYKGPRGEYQLNAGRIKYLIETKLLKIIE